MNLNVKLTRRQTEVAECVGFGYSVKETAFFLGTSYSTIKVTLKTIYAKVGIQKATELAKFVYVRKFGLDVTKCEPAKRLVSAMFLGLYLTSMAIVDDAVVARRARTSRGCRIELVRNNRREV